MAKDIEVTASDIEGLAAKLSDFIDTLTPGERIAFQIVEWYLAMHALEEEREVSGYMAMESVDHARLWRSVASTLVAAQKSGNN